MKRRKGFTLIELLVVIAIIAILMSILMPGLRAAREQAKKVTCMANLKGLGTSIAMYLVENENRLPMARPLDTKASKGFNSYGVWDNQWTIDYFGDSKPYYEYEPRHINTYHPALTVSGYNPYGSAGSAYWGVAFRDYSDRKDLYHCPDGGLCDDWGIPGSIGLGTDAFQQYFYYSSYGNVRLNNGLKVSSADRLPEELVYAFDSMEQTCEGSFQNIPGDIPAPPRHFVGSLSATDGVDWNLNQWRDTPRPRYGGPNYGFWQVFRHSDRFCNALWMDSHVSNFVTDGLDDFGEDIDERWFVYFKAGYK